MTPEDRIRDALGELAEALVDLGRQRIDPERAAASVDLLSPAEFGRRASLGRSSVYLGLTDGSIRSVKVRGRRLIPATELGRLVEAAEHKKAARAIVSPRAALTEGSSHAPRRRTA